MLAYLSQNEGINQSGLAEFLDVEPITLGRIIDKLESFELIERRPHPSDRRIWLLYLTAAALPKLTLLRELGDRTRQEALAGVSEADREHLMMTLKTLKSNLTEAFDAPATKSKASKSWLISTKSRRSIRPTRSIASRPKQRALLRQCSCPPRRRPK